MSFTDLEYSTQRGQPSLRFLFTQGETEYRYTTEDMIVSDSNGTFEPEAILISKLSQTNELAKDGLKVTFLRDNAFSLLFQGGVPEQLTSLFVYRGHMNDPDEDYGFAWKGRVAGVSFEGDRLVLECENIFTSMRRPGLRARYQKLCRHALYQARCGVDLYDFATVTTASAIEDTTVTIDSVVDSSAGVSNGYFTGGIIEKNGFYRHITRHSGTTLTILRPFPTLSEEIDSAGPTEVILYPGCDHTRDTCINKFNNVENFGGFPWIPNKNPFASDVKGSIA